MTSGWPGLRSYVAVGLVALAIGGVNALSMLDDSARMGEVMPVWRAFGQEYTSGLAVLAVSPLVAWAVMKAPPGVGWRRLLAVHPAATVVFSLAHVALMVAFRQGLWFAFVGRAYRFGSVGEWFYEYRKDVLVYALLALCFWLPGLRRRSAAAPPAAAGDPVRVTLQDGARPMRFEVDQVLAAEACGNYVELVLADGRRPLVRTTLAKALEALAPHGFVRTHRSWIVCSAAVVGVEPTGTGDWSLRLAGELEAPLSRRFPEALRRIRNREAA